MNKDTQSETLVQKLVKTARTGEAQSVYIPGGEQISFGSADAVTGAMPGRKRWMLLLLLLAAAFVFGALTSGCGGNAAVNLPLCEQTMSTGKLLVETCVDFQDSLAICHWDKDPQPTVSGCVSPEGIECVVECPANHYTKSTSTNEN